jgi:hypothetical protein
MATKIKVGERCWWAYEWTYISGKVESLDDGRGSAMVRTDCGKVLTEVSLMNLKPGKCPHLRY